MVLGLLVSNTIPQKCTLILCWCLFCLKTYQTIFLLFCSAVFFVTYLTLSCCSAPRWGRSYQKGNAHHMETVHITSNIETLVFVYPYRRQFPWNLILLVIFVSISLICVIFLINMTLLTHGWDSLNFFFIAVRYNSLFCAFKSWLAS